MKQIKVAILLITSIAIIRKRLIINPENIESTEFNPASDLLICTEIKFIESTEELDLWIEKSCISIFLYMIVVMSEIVDADHQPRNLKFRSLSNDVIEIIVPNKIDAISNEILLGIKLNEIWAILLISKLLSGFESKYKNGTAVHIARTSEKPVKMMQFIKRKNCMRRQSGSFI